MVTINKVESAKVAMGSQSDRLRSYMFENTQSNHMYSASSFPSPLWTTMLRNADKVFPRKTV